MLKVKILGPGCMRCKKLETMANEAATLAGIDATFIKVKDMDEIMKYEIISTPGLVINEKVICSGRIPAQAELINWMNEAAENDSRPSSR